MSSTDGKPPRPVPKFGSFKPKTTSTPNAESRPTASGEAADEARARHRHHSHSDRDDRDRHRHRDRGREHEQSRRRHSREDERERHRDRDRHRHRDEDRDQGRGGEKYQERPRERGRDRDRERKSDSDRYSSRSLTLNTSSSNRTKSYNAIIPNNLFTIDTKGDPLIIRYGGNDRSKIPSYYRSGRGKILGSQGRLIIHRDGPRDTFSLSFSREALGSAFRDKTLVAQACRWKARRIKPPSSSSAQPAAYQEEFIPLEPSKKRKRGPESPDASEDETPDYRSIYGKVKPESYSSSSDSENENADSEEIVTKELSNTRSRSVTLIKHLRSQPTDFPSWLDLISLQDALFAEDHGHRPRTPEECRALAELKLHLYQEAISHCSESGKEMDTLLEDLMKLGVSKVWDDRTAVKKWDQLGQNDKLSFNLWKTKLNWEMGRVGTCTFDGVKGMMVERLKNLVNILREGQGQDEELCTQIVYVFLRLTRFLHDTGYAELAVAAWQAILEGTFHRPVEEEDPKALSASISDFWESEVPRMGEEGAKGWRHFVEAAEMGDLPEIKTDKRVDEVQPGDDGYRAWAAVEQQRIEAARMPARTLDEVAEDDPFRVVMFSDIEDFLVWFPSSLLPAVRAQLLDAFLVFCRLPPAQISGVKANTLSHDPFLTGRGQAFHAQADLESQLGLELEISKQPPEFSQQGGNLAISPDVLFSGSTWFKYLDKWPNTQKPRDTQVDLSWVLGTLKQLVRVCGVEGLAEYYLAMEWHNAASGARKVAKALLKQYSSNLRLYNAYALIEFANGNVEVSHKVLQSATSLELPNSCSQLLYNTWAWLHLESSQLDLALLRLCSSVDKSATTVSPTLILKSRTHFSTTRDYSFSLQDIPKATQHAESLILLDYLSQPTSSTQGNITAALTTLPQSPNELLLQTASHLLYHYATSGPHRPSYIREQLLAFLSHFPSNTIFLSLLQWSTSSIFQINDPVRHALSSISSPTPYDRRFAIMHELRSGTAHSTKLAFESALESSSSSSSGSDVGVWTSYIRFAISQIRKQSRGKQREKERSKAKEVFYRAVAACPWAKEVYMEGFHEELGLSGEELRAVVDTMVGKGLRIFVDLDGGR
ncbi:NRDE-2, necessary for RNA interference-domain-containing protein [Cladorrhinum sp. PSN259]|nr:NRDE-2, necessary for RNA interference-domain-containing protein [Cladorrhinum sp. PSN259]